MSLALVVGFLQIGSLGAVHSPLELRCSCIGVQDLPEALSSSDAVFLGTVVDASGVLEVPLSSGADGADIMLPRRVIDFSVLSAWKGIEDRTVRVHTGMTDGDCGFPFRQGDTYLVFVRAEGGDMTTGICSRTAGVHDALTDLVELGQPGYTPELG